MFATLLWPLTAFSSLVMRRPLLSVVAGCAIGLLAFASHHEAWGATLAMFVGFVLIAMSETAARLGSEQGVAAGD